MGLFTNRKKDADDVAGLSEAANMLARLSDAPEDELPAEATVTGFSPTDETLAFSPADETSLSTDVAVLTESPVLAETAEDSPAQNHNPFMGFPATPIAEVSEAPRRRLEDRPRAQAGNVEIDAAGLLALLGVDKTASLTNISEAHQRFVAEHQPADTDDADAAQIKKRIRSEVNSAYASFRLTYAS